MKNKITVSVLNMLSVEVESEELNFKDLKDEVKELFKFANNLVKPEKKESSDEIA